MDILIALLIILGIMISVVVYQSRKDKPPTRVYLQRFSHLVVMVLGLFKDMGLCLSAGFRNLNWDLTRVGSYTDPSPDRNSLPPIRLGCNDSNYIDSN